MDRILVSASTGAMNSVLGKLANLMRKEFTKLKNLRKGVKFVSDELASMKDALEGLSYLDELDPQTKRWRDIVREMSYDIEEIIDDFMQNTGGTDKSDGFVGSTIQRLKTLRARHRIARQIKDVKKLVLETSARRQRYKIDTSSSGNVAIDPRVATLYENVANLVGVEEPTNELINLLRDEEKELKVVSIVGFGGLGKTTLANVVYGKLKGEFSSCTAFVLVSQKPDIPKLLRGLLSQLGVEPSIHACESHLIDMLRERLKNERYLIIIDDIWDVSAWDVIKCAFPENHLGSRVITTTRIQVVAKACCFHGHDRMSHVRSVMFFGRSESTPDLLQFKFLRVLCINLHRAKVDLGGLSKLYQLRYLRISRFCFYQLPTHIRVLQNLQTLDLGRYSNMRHDFLSDIVHLPHLTYLNVGSELFDGIGNMKSLRHLFAFDLGFFSKELPILYEI